MRGNAERRFRALEDHDMSSKMGYASTILFVIVFGVELLLLLRANKRGIVLESWLGENLYPRRSMDTVFFRCIVFLSVMIYTVFGDPIDRMIFEVSITILQLLSVAYVIRKLCNSDSVKCLKN